MSIEAGRWPSDSICFQLAGNDAQTLAPIVYERTCRTSFDAPGFCVVNLGGDFGSSSLRQLMVDLKREMAQLHSITTGQTLVYLSAARFDQQETTRPHLDGGPEECFLMLGYEPSNVDSQLEISDYSKCAFDMGVTPKQFMSQHNPIFQAGYEMLRPYTTRIPCFSRSDFQIVCINNSSADHSNTNPAWQGTLHTAVILTPDESERRVINSTMIASVPAGTPDSVSEAQQADFVSTSTVRRRGYDKPHLNDDT